jgi:predicted AAA+ superfamily ATPase
MYKRRQTFEGLDHESAFIWGARQTGKSTLLKALFRDSQSFDLLLGEIYERFRKEPSLLRQTLDARHPQSPVIIDEIQRLPELLNEVHWLIENRGIQFILSGSSPRRIIRAGGNLLGGRALRYELFPLSWSEIPDFDLSRALNHGLLPKIYLSSSPQRLLAAYTGNYLKDEVMAEARIRNAASFASFLDAAAFSNGEMVNYTNIATECGVSSPTVREYFGILEDALVGRFLSSYRKKPKRRVILAPKFWFFDLGIAGHLLKRGKVQPGSESFGKAFEHFIYQEIQAHRSYSGLDYDFHYWRTASGLEVDFILGDHEIAVEVKSTSQVNSRHLQGLKQFAEEYKTKRRILVSNDPLLRIVEGIDVIPWKVFLEQLWGGEVVAG